MMGLNKLYITGFLLLHCVTSNTNPPEKERQSCHHFYKQYSKLNGMRTCSGYKSLMITTHKVAF